MQGAVAQLVGKSDDCCAKSDRIVDLMQKSDNVGTKDLLERRRWLVAENFETHVEHIHFHNEIGALDDGAQLGSKKGRLRVRKGVRNEDFGGLNSKVERTDTRGDRVTPRKSNRTQCR
jgi:hypothetical protein